MEHEITTENGNTVCVGYYDGLNQELNEELAAEQDALLEDLE